MKVNKTRMLENGMSIIDLGYRKETPIALVKRDIDYKGKKEYEYIVAFNYEIINNKIEWDYGYYYGTDILKAKKDFQTVVNGGNLENTFDNNKGYFKYLDFIIEKEENTENTNEIIVQIYESEQNYIDGDYLERVSIEKNNLESNIKEYIEQEYFERDIKKNIEKGR